MKTTATILGLGLMGTGMASRLLEQGFAVTVYNRSPQKAEPLREKGAIVKSTPREAVAGSSVVISMLADDDAARAVWLGDQGALNGVPPGTILIECSTVSVDWIRELSAAAAKAKCDLLDAPVTGTKPHAATGQLLFLVGGSETTLAAARPVLAALSRDIIHLGPSGSGALMKLINNFVCGVQAVALAEGIAAIERSNLNVEKAVEVLTTGAPGSPLVKALSARMLARDYTPNFILRLMAKDLRYAIKQTGTEMDVATAALNAMDRAIQSGLGQKDFSAVVELLRANTKGSS